MKLKSYEPPSKNHWQGRDDGLRERIFQVIELIDLQALPPMPLRPGAWALIGFKSDTGIKRNKGRVGAKEGPQAFRNSFGNLSLGPTNYFYDLGDISCDDEDLKSSQKELGLVVAWALKQNLRPLVIGGGHELSWGVYQGAASVIKDSIGIINFDAHFDLRPLKEGKGNSGTGFFEIANFCEEEARPFDYLVLGLEPATNTSSLFKTAQKLKASFVSAEEIHQNSPEYALLIVNNFIAKHEYIYLSLCLDVFAQAFAPGVSAPGPLGIYPAQAVVLLKALMKSKKVLCMDIAELSPPLDENNKTAKLAAFLAYVMTR